MLCEHCGHSVERHILNFTGPNGLSNGQAIVCTICRSPIACKTMLVSDIVEKFLPVKYKLVTKTAKVNRYWK